MAFGQKKKVVEEGQAKLQEIIVTREAYFAFSVRRLRHAYKNLGATLAGESRGIVAAFGDLANVIREVRENIDGILDGSYSLPEAAPVPSITAGEEEEEDSESHVAAAPAREPKEPEPEWQAKIEEEAAPEPVAAKGIEEEEEAHEREA
jgi:hypothetical protein